MNLLFRRGDHSKADIWDKIIMAATGGPYVHVELEFSDGRCFSSQVPKGVHLIDEIVTSNLAIWDVLELPWSETPSMIHWAESIVGQPYDYVGAIGSGVGLAVEIPGRWFCSEVCIVAVSRVGAVGIPPLLSPSALYDCIYLLCCGEEPGNIQQLMQERCDARLKSACGVEWATTHEESIVQGWQSQLYSGCSPAELSCDIERWYNNHK